MKRFLDELNKGNSHLHDTLPSNTEAQLKRRYLQDRYSKFIGSRALFTDKVLKENRVVIIEEVGSHFLVVSYKYYGMDYEGKIRTTVHYMSILCGDSELKIE